ncbi:MAG: lipopolysaccharide biosynthesis protein [Clostridiales bacterium]|nr:lipopolysaccharide biosynthesis protein [Clostridiales bacterium]
MHKEEDWKKNQKDDKVKSSKVNVLGGFFWNYAERITAQLVSLIVSVILARLLEPEHYGVVSIVMIFISVGDVFVTGGFGNALVQKKDAEEIDFNTVLICSGVMSLFVYIVIFLAAPYIAIFYGMPAIKTLLRVLGLRIPVAGVNSIQHARIQKKMAFKKFFISTLIGTIISAFIGIIMAYKGAGEWALVAQYLSNAVIDTVILYLSGDWRPKLMFSIQRARILMSYGWKVLGSTLISSLEINWRNLIIGKQFGTDDLAFYHQGSKLPNVFVANIISSISKVIFPLMASEQDNKNKVKAVCRTSIQEGIFLMAPLMIGLIAVGDNFVRVVFTDKWLPCVQYLRILSLVYLVRPMTSTCMQAILAMGRSGIVLKIEIFLNVIALSLVSVSVFYYKSVLFIAVGNVVTEIISLIIHMYFIRKLIGYHYREQIRDVIPCILLSCVMGIICYGVTFVINAPPIVLLIIQIVLGAVIYTISTLLFRIDGCIYILKSIEPRLLDSVVHRILNKYLYLK